MAAPRRTKSTKEEEFRGDLIEEEERLQIESRKNAPVEKPITSVHSTKTERSHSMSMIDPSEWNLEDATELETLPEGSEVCLRILSVKKSEYGNEEDGFTEYWQPTFEVVDIPSARDFTHFLTVPNKRNMSPKQYQQAQYNLKVWMQWLGMNLSQPFSPVDDWPGMGGWAILSVKESSEYGKQNFVKNSSSGHPSGGFIIK